MNASSVAAPIKARPLSRHKLGPGNWTAAFREAGLSLSWRRQSDGGGDLGRVGEEDRSGVSSALASRLSGHIQREVPGTRVVHNSARTAMGGAQQ